MIIQLDAYGYSWIKLWIRGIQQDTVDLLQNAVGYEGCGEIQTGYTGRIQVLGSITGVLF